MQCHGRLQKRKRKLEHRWKDWSKSPALCEPETQAIMPGLEEELVEETEECYAAKQQLLNADSDEAAELATRKVRVLCNG